MKGFTKLLATCCVLVLLLQLASAAQKTKRGIYGGYGALRPHFHALAPQPHHHHHHGVAFNALPLGLNGFYPHHHPKVYSPSIYSRIPGVFKTGVAALPGGPLVPQQYAITHGGASVQSYSANYPRFPTFYNPRPVLSTPAAFPGYPVVPNFPRPLATPVVFPQAAPAAPFIPVVPFKPKVPVVPFVHQKPLVPNAFFPTPGVYPAALQPQFIPIPVGAQTPTIFNLAPTTATAGTTLIPQQPWRPVIVNQPAPTPTAATIPTITKPPGSLLPPLNIITTSDGGSGHSNLIIRTTSQPNYAALQQEQQQQHLHEYHHEGALNEYADHHHHQHQHAGYPAAHYDVDHHHGSY